MTWHSEIIGNIIIIIIMVVVMVVCIPEQASCSLCRPTMSPKSCGWSSSRPGHWHQRCSRRGWCVELIHSSRRYRLCTRPTQWHRQQLTAFLHRAHIGSLLAHPILRIALRQWRRTPALSRRMSGQEYNTDRGCRMWRHPHCERSDRRSVANHLDSRLIRRCCRW